jgi:hypothetical protein
MDTRPVIEHLKATEERLRRKIEDMRGPLAQAEEDLRSIAGTIAFYERSAPVPQSATLNLTANPVSVFSAASIRNMTQKQAVVAIARHNGGIIRAQEAKHLMIQAGIMKVTKNSTRMVHNAIISSDRFDRIAPGTFRLRVSTSLGAPTTAIAAGVFHPKPQ